MRASPCLFSLVAILGIFLGGPSANAADKTVLLIAGSPSHPAGQHEHNAGMLLLQKCLANVRGLKVEVALNGWPQDAAAVRRADAVLIYSDGEGRHPALPDANLASLDEVAKRGGGIGFLHYAVEPSAQKGQPEFLRWIGGAFESHWSVNPHWDAAFKSLPVHPITRGVRPFTLRDEWYFNLRFVDGMKGITPLLMAVPPAETMARRDGPHEGNPHARAAVARGDAQTVAWALERPGGGRGFGLSGAHFHRNWGHDDFRRLVLNAILWLAQVDVPAQGVESTVTAADLEANLDPKPARKAPTPKQ